MLPKQTQYLHLLYFQNRKWPSKSKNSYEKENFVKAIVYLL